MQEHRESKGISWVIHRNEVLTGARQVSKLVVTCQRVREQPTLHQVRIQKNAIAPWIVGHNLIEILWIPLRLTKCLLSFRGAAGKVCMRRCLPIEGSDSPSSSSGNACCDMPSRRCARSDLCQRLDRRLRVRYRILIRQIPARAPPPSGDGRARSSSRCFPCQAIYHSARPDLSARFLTSPFYRHWLT